MSSVSWPYLSNLLETRALMIGFRAVLITTNFAARFAASIQFWVNVPIPQHRLLSSGKVNVKFKGDRGMPGPPGPPGAPGTAQLPALTEFSNNWLTKISRRNVIYEWTGSYVNQCFFKDPLVVVWKVIFLISAIVRVYPSTHELFSSRVQIGTLAFATATQQLYIKVNNGWKEVALGAFYPMVEHFASRQNGRSGRVRSSDLRSTSGFQIHLIALNEPFDGNMHGMRGADLQCYRQSRMAGFTTTFRAMLSSDVQDMLRIVHTADWDTPVVNIRGEHLFASWRAVLNDGQRSTRPLYSFSRHDVLTERHWPEKRIWHGSATGGIRAGDYCDGWRSNYCKETKLSTNYHSNSITNMSKFHGDKILKKRRLGKVIW
ncbi:unnamed protein product [Haemonchus placei]|uniref:Endostatin domain-containing protein n=1 Tax=Haemonchus placei TaxID=6290 RepID=A0A0N4X6F5_HAEPC|nr:unnamed protein product [Haemonchus placei]